MDLSKLQDQIARVAHLCWCKKMMSDGWRPGKLMDERSRTLDGLVPYERLPASIRMQLRRSIGWDEFEDQLAECAEWAMNHREWCADDVFKGMRVQFADSDELGRIVSWEVLDPATGLLGNILVEWDDGEKCEHHAGEQVLLAVDEDQENEPKGKRGDRQNP